jgi:putative peptidoglycan lipid II flippase
MITRIYRRGRPRAVGDPVLVSAAAAPPAGVPEPANPEPRTWSKKRHETKLTRVFATLFPINIAVQVVSFAAWVAFAHFLGASTSTDGYLIGFSVPVFVYGVLLTAIRSGAIPGLVEEASAGASAARAADELVAASLAASAVLGVLVTGIAFAAVPLFLPSDAHLLSVTRLTIVELSPLTVLGAMTGVLAALLAVQQSFAPAVAVMVFDPLFRVVLIALWGSTLGIQTVILGNLLGSAVAVVVLWMLVRRSGIPLKLVRPRASPFVRSVTGVSAPLMISASVLQINPAVDRAMAGSLKPGSVTGLELGLRLVPTGLFVALLVSPLAATWSARKVHEGIPALRASLYRALATALLVVLPLTVVGCILRDQLVTLAFHGGAYSATDLAETSAVFGMFVVGLPAQVLGVIFTTLFIVQSETVFPMKIGFANVALNVILNFAFRPLFGASGIALSTSITFAILVAVQAIAAQRRWPDVFPSVPVRPLLALAGALVAAAVVVEGLLSQFAAAESRLDAAVVLMTVGSAGLLTYGAAVILGRRFAGAALAAGN